MKEYNIHILLESLREKMARKTLRRSGGTNRRRNHPPKSKTKAKYCNPNTRNGRISKQSCFTPYSLKLLKDSYNQQNPTAPIRSSQAHDILKEIHTKSDAKCKEDMCLINRFAKDQSLQKKLKTMLLPPPKPDDWYNDPDTWLTNFDIMDVLNQYEKAYPNFAFIGPSPIDYNTRLNSSRCVCQKLCKMNLHNYLHNIEDARGVPVNKIGIVFNLDPHHKRGSHWVAMFVDLEDNFVFYFNSTGARIPKRINDLAHEIIRQGKQLNPPREIAFHQNTHMEHQRQNTECGMYCMYFLITMLLREIDDGQGISGGGKKLSVPELFDYFKGKSSYGRIPDQQMFEKREEYFFDE